MLHLCLYHLSRLNAFAKNQCEKEFADYSEMLVKKALLDFYMLVNVLPSFIFLLLKLNYRCLILWQLLCFAKKWNFNFIKLINDHILRAELAQKYPIGCQMLNHIEKLEKQSLNLTFIFSSF